MTSAAPDRAGLRELAARLGGGVKAAAARSRPANLDLETIVDWPGSAFAVLAKIRARPWVRAADPASTVEHLTEELRARRPLLASVLFSPDLVLDRLMMANPAPGTGPVDSWLALCWTAEAAWSAVTAGLPTGAGYAAGDAELFRPLAARLRFLVLSEPFRWRGEGVAAWWARSGDLNDGVSRTLRRAFGQESWHLLVAHGQAARRTWLTCLNEYQDHPLLSQAEPAELEDELRVLAFRHATPRRGGRRPRQARFGAPLGLSVRPLAEPAALTAEDRSVLADVTDRHLLPRLDLGAVSLLALRGNGRSWRRSRSVLAVLAVLAGLAAVGCAAWLRLPWAIAAAAACYLLIGAGMLVLPASWGAMWLLRMPAAAAVGIIALVGFLPGGWLAKATPPRAGPAIAVLVLVSFGYLVIEARNHGVAAGAALGRALAVTVIGAVHALMVSLIGLVLVTPAFVSSGGQLAKLWHSPGYGHAGTELVLATAWCLAVGVFSQILWDDRPITAPLAHLSWRNR